MGQVLDKNASWGHFYDHIKDPDTTPHYNDTIGKHDPQLGFDRPRKVRQETMTIDEHESCNLEFYERDFCSLQYVKFLKCMRDNQPFSWRCRLYKHDWIECQNEDHIWRTKEYERERRLNLRDKEIARRAAKAEAEAAAEAVADAKAAADASKQQ